MPADATGFMGVQECCRKQVMANLAKQLTQKYGQGFSVTHLQNFRKFHQAHAQRLPQIQHPLGIKFGLGSATPPIQHSPGAEACPK